VFDQHECKMFKLHFASALDFLRVFQTIQPLAANIILQAFLSNLGRVLGILILFCEDELKVK
jgi:hypothetical protein